MASKFDILPAIDGAEEEVFSAHELSVLTEIATVVSAASSIGDVYSSFAALVAGVIAWDGIVVTTPSDDSRTFSSGLQEGEPVPGRKPGMKIEVVGTLHGETMKRREPLYYTAVDGQTAELALKIPGLRQALLTGLRSFLTAPLFSQGEIVGVISVHSYEPHAFSEHDRALFERIAIFIGPAVGRFDAYEALRREDRRNKSLLKIGQLLSGARDIGDVFEQFVEELRSVLEVDRLVISVADAGSATVVDRHMYGVPVPGYEVNRVIPIDSIRFIGLDVTSHGYVLTEQSMREADPSTSPGFQANYRAGLRSAMFAGLRSEGRLVGTINLKSLNVDAYGAAELGYFERVADHVAASIDRTLARESELEKSRVREDMILSRQEERRSMDVILAKERMLSSASLELRTPLAGIMAFIDLLVRNRSGNLDEKQIRYLAIIRRNAEELTGQVDSLIRHAESKSGQLYFRFGSFEMATMLRDAVTDAVPRLAEQRQSANVESDEDVEIMGDRRQLITAIGHLIEKASLHAPPDTLIRVLGQRVGSRVELSVICHGPDGPGEFLPGVIEPSDAEDEAGTIGSIGTDPDLTYVRAVALAHGGDAVYDLTPDGGARCTIRIPLSADDSDGADNNR